MNKYPKVKHYNGEGVILPISQREKGRTEPWKGEEYQRSPMIASDGVRTFYADGTRQAVFPYHLFANLKANRGDNKFPPK